MGVAHLAAAEIDRRLTSPNHPLQYRLFDFRDGVPASATTNEPLPSAVLANDGRIWMSGSNGTFWIDPERLYVNKLAPTVSIEAVYTNERRHPVSPTIRLAPLPSNVRIEYAAPSLSIPERVQFRYRLLGVDPDWQDADSRRAAFYTRLPPGRHQFQVIASNNDGVWNDVGATTTIEVEPAFFQTSFFVVLCIAATCGTLWLAYWLRVRRLAAQMHARLEERIDERTRIARELHDTLLQTVHGSKLVADQALRDAHDHERVRRAIEQLSAWLARASDEARSALNSLRTAATEANDLRAGFQRALDECRGNSTIEASLVVTGDTKPMRANVSDEIYRIGYEGIRNAYLHSDATQIQVRLEYDIDVLCIVRDNGIGVQPDIVEKGRTGHFGLLGMRERAQRIGATLTVVADPKGGTVVTLVVPGRIAFQ
jgi:signal transduction histidine kinase